MSRRWTILSSYLSLLIAATVSMPLSSFAMLTDGANAIDLLGQYADPASSPLIPVYTKRGLNDGPSRYGLSIPYSITLDTSGHRLFITDSSNHRVLVFSLNTDNTLSDRVPDNVLGQPNYISNTSATTQNGIYSPYGLAYDTVNSRLFIAEYSNNRVTVQNVSSITDGQNASNVLGQPNYISNTSATTQNGIRLPSGLAYDAANSRLFIAEYVNNRVTVQNVSSITDGQNASNVLGQPNYTRNSSAVTQNGIYNPFGLAYDTVNSRLFIAEYSGHRITVQNVSSVTDGQNASNVLGQPNFTRASLATTQNGIFNPRGLAYDAANSRLFIADGNNNRITVQNVSSITNGQNAADLLGQYEDPGSSPLIPIYTKGGANNGPNRYGLSGPYSIALDTSGHRLFVAENNNNRVLVFGLNTDNTFSDRVPDNILGQPNYTRSTSATTQNGVLAPYSLVYDAANSRLFIAEYSNNRVTVQNVSSITDGQNASNVLGQPNYISNTSATTQNGIYNPRALAYDAANSRLFIAENSNHRVTVQNVSSITDGQNASNVLGQPNYTRNSSAVTQNGIYNPYGLAYDTVNSRLFIAEFSNHRVIVQNVSSITDGQNAADLIGQYEDPAAFPLIPVYTKGGINDGANRYGLDFPSGIVIDASGHRLFVAESNNNRVLVFGLNTDNTLLDRVPDNVLGQPNFTRNVSATTQNGIYSPRGLAYDTVNSRLFIVEYSNHRVTVQNVSSITDGQNASNVLGQPNFTRSTSDTTPNGIYNPFALAYDAANSRLFIADSSNHRVIVQNVSSITDGQNASNVLGQPNFTRSTSATTQNGVFTPYGLAYDAANSRLFIAENSNHRVTVQNVSSITDGQNASNVLGQPNYTRNSSAVTQNGIYNPYGLAYDTVNSRLFIAEFNSNRITVQNVSSITDGQNASNVLGQPNFTRSTSATTQNGLYNPYALAYDVANSRLFIVEYNNKRITVQNLSSITDGQNAADLLGQYEDPRSSPLIPIYTKGGANNGPNRYGLYGPYSIALDTSGHRLFVADTNNYRILVYALNADGTFVDHIPTNVLGQSNYSSDSTATTQNRLNSPAGIAFDSTNSRLFVAESNNARVVVFDASLTTSDSTPPTITSVTSSSADGAYKAGSSVAISFVFSEAVTTTGTITVVFDSGGSCTFSGVSNATAASCTYAVRAGENSSDLSIAGVSGTITDQAANAMTDFVPATNLSANKNIVIDTTPPATPAATPAGGTYTTAQSVTLASEGSSAVYFTIDGSVPTTSSSLYSAPVSVTVSFALKVLAVDVAGNESAVTEERYTILVPAIPPVGGGSSLRRNTGSSGLSSDTAQLHPSPPPPQDPLPPDTPPALRHQYERLEQRIEKWIRRYPSLKDVFTRLLERLALRIIERIR